MGQTGRADRPIATAMQLQHLTLTHNHAMSENMHEKFTHITKTAGTGTIQLHD